MHDRKRIPTGEPVNVTLGRLDEKMDLSLKELEMVRMEQINQGKQMVAIVSKQQNHAKRISTFAKQILSLQVFGVQAATTWTILKVMGPTAVVVGGIIFGVLKATQ